MSVLLTVYNAERYLGEAIQSILDQTFTDFELVIVNDGSTDGSTEIICRLAGSDSRIRALDRPRCGRVGALNHGLAHARRGLVALMDADDISLSDRLSSQVRFMEEQPDVVCSSGDFEYMDAKKRRLTVIHLPREDDQIERSALAGHPPLCHGCAMIRRDALLGIGGYNAELWPAEDLDLYLRLLEVGRLANLDRVLLRVRLHEKSVGGSHRDLQHAKAREACERAYKRRRIVGHCEVGEPWRPGNDRESRHKFAIQCGWWAFNSGERRTAMIYGVKAIGLRPLSSDGWRLLACAAIKRPRARSNT